MGAQTFTSPAAVRAKEIVITDVMRAGCGCREAAMGFLGLVYGGGAWHVPVWPKT